MVLLLRAASKDAPPNTLLWDDVAFCRNQLSALAAAIAHNLAQDKTTIDVAEQQPQQQRRCNIDVSCYFEVDELLLTTNTHMYMCVCAHAHALDTTSPC